MMRPYEALQVPRDADDATIKAAYRKLSKSLHPDRCGGNREAFERLKLAYDILINPVRRDQYDRTGDDPASRVTPELMKSHLRSIILSMMEDTTNKRPWQISVRSMANPLQRQIILLEEAINHNRRHIESFREERLSVERFLGKIKKMVNHKGNLVRDLIREKIAEIDQRILTEEDAIVLAQMIIQELRTYDFLEQVDAEPEGQSDPAPTAQAIPERITEDSRSQR